MQSQNQHKMGDIKSDKVFILAGRATANLASRIAKNCGRELEEAQVNVFHDGEFMPTFDRSVRGGTVFIIQSTMPPTDNLFELLMLVDACRRDSAEKVIAVLPYYGFARQDRKVGPHEPIGAKLVANMIAASGVDGLMCMDLHASQIQGYFDLPVTHLFGSSIFMPYIRENFDTDEVIFASPDLGGSKRADKYARTLGTDFVCCYKHREVANQIASMRLLGDVKDKHVVLLDDLIDTGGTICKAAKIIMDNGAKSVRAMITHPVLSHWEDEKGVHDAIDNIENSVLEELVVTDTIPMRRQSSKINVLSCDWLFGEAINRTVNHQSINELYEISIRQRGTVHRISSEE